MKIKNYILMLLLMVTCSAMQRAPSLMDAVREKNLKKVKEILKKGVPHQFLIDKSLIVAGDTGQLEMIKALLAAGAYPDKSNQFGDTPLIKAIQGAHLDAVKALLAAGADPNKADLGGNTPLIKASRLKHVDIVKVLLAAGADPDKTNLGGNTPLIEASKLEHLYDKATVDEVKQILRKAQEIQKLKKKSFELLDEIEKDPQRVHEFILLMDKELMKKGIMRMVDEQKNTLLHKAAEIGNVALAQSILKRAPSLIAEKNNAGFTPIELAIAKGRFNVVKMFTEEATRAPKAVPKVME